MLVHQKKFLLHGLVEFNMSLPATPVTLAALLGLAIAAARHERPKDRDPAGALRA